MLYENDDSTPLVIGNLQNPVTMIRIPEEKRNLLSFNRSSFFQCFNTLKEAVQKGLRVPGEIL